MDYGLDASGHYSSSPALQYSNKNAVMLIEVECHAGYRYPERPLVFILQGKRFKVNQVLDRWYGEEAQYFKVLAEDGLIYLLRYAPGQEAWTLDGLFQPPGYRPRGEAV